MRRKYREDVQQMIGQLLEFYQAMQWSKSTKHRRKVTAKHRDVKEYLNKMSDFTTYYALLGLTFEHIGWHPFYRWRVRRILHKQLEQIGKQEVIDESKEA